MKTHIKETLMGWVEAFVYCAALWAIVLTILFVAVPV